MTLHVDISPEVEARLAEAAHRRGQSIEQLAGALLASLPDDPFLLALSQAEVDDEPVTAEDLADIDAAFTHIATASGIPHAEMKRRSRVRG